MTVHDPFEPPASGGSRWLRGALVVVVAVVIGALLMPSATRAPLAVPASAQSAASSTTTSPSPAASFPTARSTTTIPAPTTTTTAAPTVVPGASSIHVLVANGTSITGLAGGVASYLRSRGFGTLSATNASTKVSATQVYAAAGQQGAATTVVNALGLPASAVQPTSAVAPVSSTSGATAVVIAGPDLARLAPTSAASGSSTSSAH